MSTCHEAACPATVVHPYKVALRHTIVLLCDEHAASLTNLGLGLYAVERRVESLPVIHERRAFRPRWMDRLTSRDETGRMAS